jgi:GNAT superfamily N-acetyltransferase
LSGINHGPRPTAGDIGNKVSIRLHDGDGYRDLLGVLTELTQVQKKDGTTADFEPSQIAAWRIVQTPDYPAGKGQPLSVRIAELERIAEKTWPGTTTEIRGGWRYRISDGFTFRGNSILPVGSPPLGEPLLAIDDELAFAIDRYRKHGITPAIHIPMPLYEQLDEHLAAGGWELRIEAHLMIADATNIAKTALPAHLSLEVSDTPSEEWLAVQGKAAGYEVMLNYPAKYLALRSNDSLVSVMRMSEADQWAVLSRLFVAESERGRGYSKAIISQALARFTEPSTNKVALQVDSTNAPAIALYTSLGFRVHHNYRFRVKA